jgi:hypothetical protein
MAAIWSKSEKRCTPPLDTMHDKQWNNAGSDSPTSSVSYLILIWTWIQKLPTERPAALRA